MNKKIDTSLLDKAIIFATNAHQGVERRGKGFPYIIHPLDALVVASTMTNDQEILAATVLHDVVEDTKYTIEDIRREFGDRVADIVNGETSLMLEGEDENTSWRRRKQATIDKLKNASFETKIVALSDKYVNMRDIKNDYLRLGNEFWNTFHSKDPKDHKWYYTSLVEALSDLKEYKAYHKFKYYVDSTFKDI